MALLVVLGVSTIVLLGASATRRVDVVFQGACYCKIRDDLQCTADLSERECTRRCSEALCEEWFWLERRPCWNWGYGG